MRTSIVPIVVAMFAASVSAVAAGGNVTGDTERSFFPYEEAAALPEVAPVISQGNWQSADGLLPGELLEKVKSGELEIRTREATDLPPSPSYIEATRRGVDQIRLQPDGSLEGYVGGRPFPRIDPADPQAGLKLAWNSRYHESLDSARAWGLFRMLDATGQEVRNIEFYYALAYGMHRADASANVWAGEGIFLKEFLQCLAPHNVRNIMILRFRYDDDRTSDLNFAWIPEIRKVRQINVDPRASMISSELLSEDFYGFWGHLYEYDWRFLGRATLLAPVAVRAATATFEPRRGYPTDPWEPRKVLLLESTPKNDVYHPYAKRVLYIDEQMGVPLYVLAYDRQGRHYKTIFTVYGDPAFSPGNEAVRGPLWYGNAAINHDTGNAAVTVMYRTVVDARVQRDLFTTGHLDLLAR
jgi:uncharacterized protein DUF1329